MIVPATVIEMTETTATDVNDVTTAMTGALGLHRGVNMMIVARDPLRRREIEMLQGMIHTDGGMLKIVEDLTTLIEGATTTGTQMATTVEGEYSCFFLGRRRIYGRTPSNTWFIASFNFSFS